MMHDDIEDSLIQGRLDIYPLQVDEEDLPEMNDKELNDQTKDLVFLNYESVDSYTFTDFYCKKHNINQDIRANITGGEFKIVSFNENYLDICNYRAYIPACESTYLTFAFNHLLVIPNIPDYPFNPE